jgi:hypothetical protein
MLYGLDINYFGNSTEFGPDPAFTKASKTVDSGSTQTTMTAHPPLHVITTTPSTSTSTASFTAVSPESTEDAGFILEVINSGSVRSEYNIRIVYLTTFIVCFIV